jgi:hypothetical protein|tara:strand:- start:1120 stop:1755 length:636 start_codon:yes stop_codon:yes gene_type:complete
MEKRPLYIKRIILSIIIATILFIGGFFISFVFSYFSSQSVISNQNDLYYELLSVDVENRLNSITCGDFEISKLSNELDKMGGAIQILEKRWGKQHPEVLSQKKSYLVLQMQHFLLIKRYSDNCNIDMNSVLFFYSNVEPFLGDAERVGYIVTSYKNQGKDVQVYSVDYDLDSELAKILRDIYDVNFPNTLIINEKYKIINPQNIDELYDAI